MIQGTDISKWEDDLNTTKKIDFNKMVSAGAEFCIFKASQRDYADPVFLLSWRDAKAAGLIRGAYHFMTWDRSGADQARYFWNLIASDPPDIPPIVDFEAQKGIAIPTDAVVILRDYVTTLATLCGRKPMIYCSPAFWVEHGSPDPWWAQFPRWIAHYGVAQPTLPPPWTEWKIWQYTPSGDGLAYGAEATTIDLNWFNGTVEDLRAFCGLQPEEVTRYKTTQMVNVRSFPVEIPGNIIGTLPAGTIVQVDGVSGTRSHIVSPKVGWVWTGYLVATPLSLEERVEILEKEARKRGWPV